MVHAVGVMGREKGMSLHSRHERTTSEVCVVDPVCVVDTVCAKVPRRYREGSAKVTRRFREAGRVRIALVRYLSLHGLESSKFIGLSKRDYDSCNCLMSM